VRLLHLNLWVLGFQFSVALVREIYIEDRLV